MPGHARHTVRWAARRASAVRVELALALVQLAAHLEEDISLCFGHAHIFGHLRIRARRRPRRPYPPFPPAAGRSSWPTATMSASARRIKCSIVRVLWIQQVCISNKPPQTPVWPALERRRALAVSRAPPGPPCGECFLISLHTTDLKFQALVETFFPPRQQLRVPSSCPD